MASSYRTKNPEYSRLYRMRKRVEAEREDTLHSTEWLAMRDRAARDLEEYFASGWVVRQKLLGR